ncbi:hypothetical protein OKW33_003441 [Paraburkholderia atlantica]
MYTVCHRPTSLGKSRQGQPVRPIQRTASTNQRLSLAVRPGSHSLPGKTDSIRAHKPGSRLDFGKAKLASKATAHAPTT